jgi:hypothetical protein
MILPHAAAGPELLKRLYCRPDYQAIIKAYAAALIRRFYEDPEAFDAFKELLSRYGISLEANETAPTGERIAPLVAGLIVGGAFVGGAVLGYFAEAGKADNK